MLKVPNESLPHFAHVASRWIPPITDLNSTDDIEVFAEDLCRALADGIKAVGKRSSGGKAKSAPWCNSDCKTARVEYRNAITETERKKYAKIYRTTIASAKREYWKNRVEAMSSLSDIFKLMRWAKPCPRKTPPPLFHKGKLITEPLERANALRDNLLARYEASEDLPAISITEAARILWAEELSEPEVKSCTINSGNTCLGADEITVELLIACWDNIGNHVTHLFRACLRLRYHSSCFKLAEVVFLPKTGRDPTSIKGWRPIALLSCLGKGLERLIAKRMSYLAITLDVVRTQQFGALSKRSAIDLVSCVVHNIEEARTQKWSTTFVTLDVQGAFDAVLHNRLLKRIASILVVSPISFVWLFFS